MAHINLILHMSIRRYSGKSWEMEIQGKQMAQIMDIPNMWVPLSSVKKEQLLFLVTCFLHFKMEYLNLNNNILYLIILIFKYSIKNGKSA